MMKNKPSKIGLSSLGGLVYSTDTGRMCPACRQSVANCVCKAQAVKIQAKAEQAKTGGAVRVLLQTKGRGGKSVTLVNGLPLDAEALALLAKQLRAACGSGGTAKGGVVEVQGDHVVAVMATLQKLGYNAKRSGG